MSKEIVKMLKELKNETCKEPKGYVEYMLIAKPLTLEQIKSKAYPFTKEAVESAVNELNKSGVVKRISFGQKIYFALTPADEYFIKGRC
jgi:predicted transcriptional regulator